MNIFILSMDQIAAQISFPYLVQIWLEFPENLPKEMKINVFTQNAPKCIKTGGRKHTYSVYCERGE